MFQWMNRSPQAEHQFCQDNLSSFLDRQLTSREQDRVARHLQECADCRADLASLRQTVAVLHAMPAIKPPRTFFIPASEGVRQTQVRRSRLAYGYLQFATAVATVLLVLVVSGDALLRLGVATPTREGLVRNVERTALDTRAGEVEPMATSAPALQAPAPAPVTSGAVPLSSEESTVVTMLGEAAPPEGASQTETAQAMADEQALGAKAMPSQTFARPAAAPPLPAGTQESGAGTPPAAETAPSEPVATLEPGPTAALEIPTPLPTEAPVPPTATPVPTAVPAAPVETPTPQPTPVALEHEELPPPALAGWRRSLQAMQPLLPWLEWILGALVVVLLAATLWLRRRQHAA